MLPSQLVGCSSKSYFTVADARHWARTVGEHLTQDGGDGVYVCPSLPLLPLFLDALGGTGARVGAQDVSQFPQGPFTGEVSAELLAELGVRYVMVGHPERRRHLGETPTVIATKVARAKEVGLVPILIVGEESPRDDPRPVLDRQLSRVFAAGAEGGDIVFAYEPIWAIGAPEPAPPEHVVATVAVLRELVARHTDSFRIVYGGSAGPGTFQAIASTSAGSPGTPDGVFLGRAGLDPLNFIRTLCEVRDAARSHR
ncbi:MAG: triosephosphate isomerase [Propionibacteriaceae bacterium]|nr:triosephosphate isomerase [Propionibacteriaceae bacterium]